MRIVKFNTTAHMTAVANAKPMWKKQLSAHKAHLKRRAKNEPRRAVTVAKIPNDTGTPR